jgi:hypothetical protein
MNTSTTTPEKFYRFIFDLSVEQSHHFFTQYLSDVFVPPTESIEVAEAWDVVMSSCEKDTENQFLEMDV